MTTAILPGTAEVIDVIPAGELPGLLVAVPVVDVRWFDDRQTCRLAHDYLEGLTEGTPDDWEACTSYNAGECGRSGRPCLFLEADDGEAWERARSWERVTLASGVVALRRCNHE